MPTLIDIVATKGECQSIYVPFGGFDLPRGFGGLRVTKVSSPQIGGVRLLLRDETLHRQIGRQRTDGAQNQVDLTVQAFAIPLSLTLQVEVQVQVKVQVQIEIQVKIQVQVQVERSTNEIEVTVRIGFRIFLR